MLGARGLFPGFDIHYQNVLGRIEYRRDSLVVNGCGYLNVALPPQYGLRKSHA